MQKLNYSWNKNNAFPLILLFLCTCDISSVSLKGFLSHHHSCSCLVPWRVDWQSLLTTSPGMFASAGKNLAQEQAGRLPPMPLQEPPEWERCFKSYFSHRTGLAVLPKGLAQLDSCSCHPVSQCNFWNCKMWWMQCVTAAVQEMGHSCTSVPQDHLEARYQK